MYFTHFFNYELIMTLLRHSRRLFPSDKLFCPRVFSSSFPKSLRERKTKIADVDINFAETTGTGSAENDKRRPIIFLPGAFGSIEMDFKPIVNALGMDTKYKWISYDPPGYGKSRPPKREFLSKTHETVHEIDVKYITGLMDMLGHQSYNVVAWSGAALSAIWIASETPERISGLVTFGSFSYVEEKMIPGVKMMKKLGINAITESRRIPLLEMYGPDYLTELWNGWCDEAVRMVQSERYRKGGTFQEKLTQVQCPTLVMQGTKDALIELAQAEHLNKSIKNSRLLVVENGTHNLHLRNTGNFVRQIETFFDETVKP